MSKFLKVPYGDYNIKVQEGGTIVLDTGENGQVSVTGLLKIEGIENYQDLVINNNDIPNKKYVDDQNVDIENSIFVTKHGNDSNSGRTLSKSKITIKSALNLAATMTPPVTVFVYPGVYVEDGNLVIPEDSNVVGVGGQYVTEVVASETARNEYRNMFLVNSGSYLKGFSFRNQKIDNFNNPSGGFAVAFAPGASIVRSPYIRDISQVSNYDKNAVAAPLEPIPTGFTFDSNSYTEEPNPLVGAGGGVLLADRSVLDNDTIFPYMLAFGATPRSPNGIGYVAKNGAGINGIGSISVFQQCAFYALNGGQITLNNSGTQFGDISMRSSGFTPVVEPLSANSSLLYKSVDSANLVNAYSSQIIDQMWIDLINPVNYPVFNNAEYEELTRRDAEKLIETVSLDLKAGTDTATKSFVLSLFDYQANYVFDISLLNGFIHSFEFIRDKIIEIITDVGLGLSTAEISNRTNMINELFGTSGGNGVIIGTLEQKEDLTFNFSSLIESLGHQFNNAGAGVNKNALPLNFRRPGENRPVPFSVLEQNSGQVRWSGADEFNNQYFAGGTRINGLTGRFEGRPFNAAVRQIARRLSNSRAML